MSFLPKIEKVTRDTTISHFLLMFGYKLFSIYFPLFLVARGMSLPEVGYTYLLIYLPIAFFSPIVGFFNYKINPAVLATIGILGYGVYVLGMILIRDPQLFYFWQVLLGISAALFFVSARTILMSSPLESYGRAFGWFYTAPFYADAIAPVIGALFIWKFNFIGVFIFSLVIQIFTAIFCFTQLKRHCQRVPQRNPKGEQVSSLSSRAELTTGHSVAGKFGTGLIPHQVKLWRRIFQKIKRRDILPSILISFSVLLLAGFYRTLFVLFLKDSLIWSQNLILIFVSVLSFLFLPASFLIIKYLGRLRVEEYSFFSTLRYARVSEKNIFQGGLITGISSILFGILVPVLSFFSILLINFGRLVGSLITNSGRSGLISQKLKENPKEAGAVDTIFAPLGIALGALISGAIVGVVGYSLLFILGGIFVVMVSLIVKKFAKL